MQENPAKRLRECPMPVSRWISRLPATLAVVAAPLLSSCVAVFAPDFDDERQDLSRSRRIWQESRVYDYDYIGWLECYCYYEGVPVRVEVRLGAVVAVTFVSSGRLVPIEYYADYPTVEGLFTILDEAIENGAYRIDADFDDHYGFPRDFFVDYERNVADEERGFRIDTFIPR
jgi:hypothetical protein